MRQLELRKHRVLQSEYQSKARRMRKIKSKTFHRHLRKREQKEKERTLLENGGDEEVGDVEEEEKAAAIKRRAEDRASLKHSSAGSKWSKKVKRLQFKDDDLMKQVNEQNALREKNRERIQAGVVESDTSDEEEEKEETKKGPTAVQIVNELGDNEWFKASEDAEEVLQNLQEAEENAGKYIEEGGGLMSLPSITSKDNGEVIPSLSKKTEIELEIEEQLSKRRKRNESGSHEGSDSDEYIEKRTEAPFLIESQITSAHVESELKTNDVFKLKRGEGINTKDVLTIKPKETEVTVTEDVDGSTTTIREAFADDDVVKAFKQSKQDVQENEKGKIVDLILPGFNGSWAGEDFKPSKGQKRRFRIKQKMAPRADRQLGHVIISEQSEKLEGKRVQSLPFPYQNAAQFHKAMSQPIGATWNTAASFREMTAPSIITTPGQIIKPATLEEKKRDSEIFTVERKEKEKQVFPKKYKRGRRKTAADDLTLSRS